MHVRRLTTSVVYIGPKSRTERPRKTKIGTDVAHVTRDTTFKVKRSTCRGQRHIVAASRTACLKITYTLRKSQGSAATIYRWGGQVYNFLMSIFFRDIVHQKLLKLVDFCRVIQKVTRGTHFFGHMEECLVATQASAWTLSSSKLTCGYTFSFQLL